MICNDTHTHCHSCWCKLFEWIRIEWIRTGGIRVEDTYWWDMYWWDTFCDSCWCTPFEWIRIEWIRIAWIRIGGIRVGGIRIGGIRIGGIRIAKPADANVLNGYALHGYVLVGYVLNGYVLVGYVLVGYVLNGYVWDMCGVMDMCGICVVWDMCGICVVWDTPTIFWRTLRRNVFREKKNSNWVVVHPLQQNIPRILLLFHCSCDFNAFAPAVPPLPNLAPNHWGVAPHVPSLAWSPAKATLMLWIGRVETGWFNTCIYIYR